MNRILFALLFLMSGYASANVGKEAYQLVEAGNTEKAIELLTLKENKEKPEALFMMGLIYDAGKGVEKDLTKASGYYLLSADKGHALAQFYIGMFYNQGIGVPKDSKQAIFWLRKAAKQKNTRAMGLLATILFSSQKSQLTEAYAWSHIAAKYDPIQAKTSARKVIASYCTKKQIEDAKKLIKKIESGW